MKAIRAIKQANKFIEDHAEVQPDMTVRHAPPMASTAQAEGPAEGARKGDTPVDIVPSAMHALPQQPPADTVVQPSPEVSTHPHVGRKDVVAQAVLFTQAFEEGYIDRLTTTLQRHAARAEDSAFPECSIWRF